MHYFFDNNLSLVAGFLKVWTAACFRTPILFSVWFCLIALCSHAILWIWCATICAASNETVQTTCGVQRANPGGPQSCPFPERILQRTQKCSKGGTYTRSPEKICKKDIHKECEILQFSLCKNEKLQLHVPPDVQMYEPGADFRQFGPLDDEQKKTPKNWRPKCLPFL